MGAADFMVVTLAKNADVAFAQQVELHRYLYGHAGYTGTMAEKDSYIMAGQINSRQEPHLEHWIDNTREWVYSGSRARYPKVGDTVQEMMAGIGDALCDKWGPAVCFEITGIVAKQYKEKNGRKGTHDRMFVFAGMASM